MYKKNEDCSMETIKVSIKTRLRKQKSKTMENKRAKAQENNELG